MSLRMSIIATAIAFVVAARPARALAPEQRITQYRHTAWRVQEGAFESAVNAIAQTADGYMWIGTDSGLVRFDGVRFRPWTPPADDRLSSTAIISLLAASDGTLWIGTLTGLLSWKNDRLQEHVSGRIGAILEDRQRRIWVARSRMMRERDLGVRSALTGGLCQVVGDHPGCVGGNDQMRLLTADALSEDAAGALWIGAPNQLMRWHDGSVDSYLRDQLEGSALPSVHSIAAAPDGSVWVAIPREGLGLFHVVKGALSRGVVQGIDTEQITSLFVDRDRSLWMGTSNNGVYRVHGERGDHFSSEHGLSGNEVHGFFEDREGNLWVVTSKGLDCFGESAVVSFSAAEGLAPGEAGTVVASDDGTIWVGRTDRLNALRGDQVTSIPVPGRTVTALFEDHAGRLWVGLDTMLTIYEHGRFRPVSRADGSAIRGAVAIAEDREHDVWVTLGITSPDRKLFRIRDLRVQQEFAPDRVPLVRRLAADPTGGIWLGFEDGNLGHYQHGTFEIFPMPQGTTATGELRLPGLTVDADGSAWISTWSGLVRWKNHEMKTLTSRNGLPCNSIVSAIRDDRATLWLNTKCGFVAIADAELEQWWERPDRTPRMTMLDALDGALLPQGPKRLQPAVAKSADGRLWFVSDAYLQMIDPAGLKQNGIPPPVYVEGVRVDRKEYAVGGIVRLPAGSRDIEISYTGLSYSIPQKVRFRYKLEGRDDQWQDAGTRRQAFYSDLPPRAYRFRVIASNNDGLWNESGASLDFSIAPAYYQTASFRTGIVVAVLALVWAMYTLRVRRLAQQFDARFQERVNERTRIARELHDTLLQSFHGVMFRFQAAANVLPDRPLDAKQRLETALKQGQYAIREGRDAVQGLRDSTMIANDLAVALRAVGEELAASEAIGAHGRHATVDVATQGTPHALRPIIRDDVYRIGSEALRNAFRHARARRIEVEIRYGARQFQLRVRDDGQGIEASTLDAHRAGHFGLPGMRERAEQIGGQLEVWSEAGMGTEVAFTIPGAAVYSSPRARRHIWSMVGRRQAHS
jgi:signal transduction histidine kinase/ligand-binding sensor domain-containing protein